MTDVAILGATGTSGGLVVGLKKGPVDRAWDLVSLGKVRKVPGIPTLSFPTVAKALVGLAPDQSQDGQKLLLTPSGGWR